MLSVLVADKASYSLDELQPVESGHLEVTHHQVDWLALLSSAEVGALSDLLAVELDYFGESFFWVCKAQYFYINASANKNVFVSLKRGCIVFNKGNHHWTALDSSPWWWWQEYVTKRAELECEGRRLGLRFCEHQFYVQ